MSEPSRETMSDTSTVPETDTQVTLHVGGRKFVTTRSTLTQESGYFSAMLSSRWNSAGSDGSFFVDADPALFEHILSYLRRGVLPVFYDNVKGHDFPLYVALLEEAKYYQIDRLIKWLEDKDYLQAVKIRFRAYKLDDVALDVTSNKEIQCHPFHWTENVYVCPRDIEVHRGNPRACGRQCRNAQGDAEDVYVEEQKLKILAVERTTVFDHAMCNSGH